MTQSNIRNFCIIAHIDHGKSTLADRLLELTGTVERRRMKEQLLDTMDLERERGITIKLQPVTMDWKGHTLNLIDTPGHVDFSYEVSRSLAACEGAIVLVDATQGVQAQTLANIHLAQAAGLVLIPAVNKIDLPAAEPEQAAGELAKLVGCEPSEVIKISGKTGEGVGELLERAVQNIPAPSGKTDAPLRALIFDSKYDEYRGVTLFVRVVDGAVKQGSELRLMAGKREILANEVGIFKPDQTKGEALVTGDIGYVVTNLKSAEEGRVGDTLTLTANPSESPLPGYREIHPFVFAGFFPASADQLQSFKDSLEKLKLSDSSLVYEPESSQILGHGFRLGFLGLLHLDIIKERLEREYGQELVITSPSTDYEVILTDRSTQTIRAASELPDASRVAEIKEPWVIGEIVVPSTYVGNVIQLINDVRGIQVGTEYLNEELALLTFEAPVARVLTDFYDRLKSVTSGYGSYNYELSGYRTEDLQKLDILVAGKVVDSLSQIVHRSETQLQGRKILEKLKELIPRQQFEVTLQAAIGAKIIAREDIKAVGKNVTAKLYGGDVTRKNKLLEKQKKGKAKMKRIGQVDIPPEAFMVLVKI